jgi:hypothetical protein
MMEAEIVSVTLEFYSVSGAMTAQEDFTALSCHKNFRIYRIVVQLQKNL